MHGESKVSAYVRIEADSVNYHSAVGPRDASSYDLLCAGGIPSSCKVCRHSEWRLAADFAWCPCPGAEWLSFRKSGLWVVRVCINIALFGSRS